MKIELNCRKAIVTGSTAGIGRTVAESLARAGASVFINGRGEERVAAAVCELCALLPTADVHGVVADVSSSEGFAALQDQSAGRRHPRQTPAPLDSTASSNKRIRSGSTCSSSTL